MVFKSYLCSIYWLATANLLLKLKATYVAFNWLVIANYIYIILIFYFVNMKIYENVLKLFFYE